MRRAFASLRAILGTDPRNVRSEVDSGLAPAIDGNPVHSVNQKRSGETWRGRCSNPGRTPRQCSQGPKTMRGAASSSARTAPPLERTSFPNKHEGSTRGPFSKRSACESLSFVDHLLLTGCYSTYRLLLVAYCLLLTKPTSNFPDSSDRISSPTFAPGA